MAAGQEHVRRSPIDLPLLAYSLVLVVGFALGRADWGGIVAHVGLSKIVTFLLEYVAVFYLVFWTARSAEKRRRLVAALVIIGACVGAYAVLEFVTGHNWLNSLDTGAGKQQLVRYVFSRADLSRARATFEHPIALGTGLAMILPLAFHLAGCAQTSMRRALAYAAAVSIGLGILACGSRGPYMAVVLVTLAFFAMERRKGVRLKVAAGVVAMAVLAVVFAGPILGRPVDLRCRCEHHVAACRLLGYLGNDVWPSALRPRPRRPQPPMYGYVDNYYLLTLGESGFVGLCLLLLLLAASSIFCGRALACWARDGPSTRGRRARRKPGCRIDRRDDRASVPDGHLRLVRVLQTQRPLLDHHWHRHGRVGGGAC